MGPWHSYNSCKRPPSNHSLSRALQVKKQRVKRALPPRAAALMAVILWGLSFVATKAALREISPITLIATRFALGLALLLVLLRARRVPLLPPRDAWPALALMGFVGVFVHQLMQSY